MSKTDEISISQFFETYLHKKFENNKYVLNKWGQVDDWIQIDNNTFVFLEVETSQKHPNTNVLKLWPFLEENKNIRVFLIQAFFYNSPGVNSSRGRLGEWTGKKFEDIFPSRFKYNKVVFNKDKLELNSTKLKDELDKFVKNK